MAMINKKIIKNRLIWLSGIVFLTLLCISLFYVGYPLYLYYHTPEPTEYTFSIEIISNNTDDYLVLLPITSDERIMENLKIVSGEGNYRIINSSYGHVIEIVSNQSINLISNYQLNDPPHKDYIFSTYNITWINNKPYESTWIYSEQSISSTNLSFKVTSYKIEDDWRDWEGGSSTCIISGYFQEGWQQVEMRRIS